jgi:hypothetical protein
MMQPPSLAEASTFNDEYLSVLFWLSSDTMQDWFTEACMTGKKGLSEN